MMISFISKRSRNSVSSETTFPVAESTMVGGEPFRSRISGNETELKNVFICRVKVEGLKKHLFADTDAG